MSSTVRISETRLATSAVVSSDAQRRCWEEAWGAAEQAEESIRYIRSAARAPFSLQSNCCFEVFVAEKIGIKICKHSRSGAAVSILTPSTRI